jgi:hypothetical protein
MLPMAGACHFVMHCISGELAPFRSKFWLSVLDGDRSCSCFFSSAILRVPHLYLYLLHLSACLD